MLSNPEDDIVKKNKIINKFFPQEDSSLKIVLLGDDHSKKSSLIFRYIHNRNPTEQDPIIEDSYTCSININGKNYEQKIIDTAGEEDYQNMLDEWINLGDGFLLVFALDNSRSFIRLKSKYQRIFQNKKNKYPFVLVGNKCEIPENEREISRNEAEELAKNWGVEYFEVSDKTDCNGNVNLVFEILSKKIITFKGKQKQKSKKCYIIFIN